MDRALTRVAVGGGLLLPLDGNRRVVEAVWGVECGARGRKSLFRVPARHAWRVDGVVWSCGRVVVWSSWYERRVRSSCRGRSARGFMFVSSEDTSWRM